MRNLKRAVLVASVSGAALTLSHAAAHAAPNPTVALSSPAENTAVISITNHLTKPNRCGARLNGFEEYLTPYTTVAPQSTITFTMTNVPAGNYSVWWGCDGYTGDRRLVMVGGLPHVDGKPQTVVSTG
ncbi:hypothetical protein [Mycobacterium sp. SMC-4]|uniref:hypothetical protein n=1 Tax=Mycobacterium sp. SMC-4 TaxID=2857059 RepID=UPI0021B22BBD|nr:hypothetical protein [Mycobacterium sp. SMC-4]UXA19118.1 hypothetical protein KXD98_05580 [Mycobacterium sp. SMC-4]